jgi:hypothetical protein
LSKSCRLSFIEGLKDVGTISLCIVRRIEKSWQQAYFILYYDEDDGHVFRAAS